MRNPIRYVKHEGASWSRSVCHCLIVGPGAGYVKWLWGSHYSRYGKRFPFLHGFYLRGFTIYLAFNCTERDRETHCWKPRPTPIAFGITGNANLVPLTRR
jgi:hypothetical protein